MDYLGRANTIKLTEKLNGTHTLTFQLVDRWFDSETGEYVRNEFIDYVFNEKKVKLHYKDQWYEFYVKNISDAKKFKSYIKTYTCSDSFIDELSRNGYGIIFDEKLYNNVEEIGVFTEEILEDSLWGYSPENNWGDFTEYNEEKMYRVPASLFGELYGYEITYDIEDAEEEIKNAYTKEKRAIEMGDDLARVNGYFWDQKISDGTKNKLKANYTKIDNDGYIYVFYTDLNFCFQTTDQEHGLVATEEVQSYGDHSYAIAPKTVDPSALIQFMAFPEGAKIEVDEAGMIVNKNYHYVMTVEQWNNAIGENSEYFYQFESFSNDNKKNFLTRAEALSRLTKAERQITGNWCAYYEDYLSSIGSLEVLTGKKISITDRTEINITDDIDQYVVVYNNPSSDFEEQYMTDGEWKDGDLDYRVCSKTATRQIVPQLARNLIENAINIKSADGWIVAKNPDDSSHTAAQVKFAPVSDDVAAGCLILTPSNITNDSRNYNMIINFGIVGQEYQIKKNKIYCLMVDGEFISGDSIIIGSGTIAAEGEYQIDEYFQLEIEELNTDGKYNFVRFNEDIKNPYLAIYLNPEDGTERKLTKAYFFEAYSKGQDQFDSHALYRYSGRELFVNDFTWVSHGNNFTTAKVTDVENRIIFEDDIMPGDTYAYKQYFIQQVYAEDSETQVLPQDTFAAKEFLSPEGNVYKNVGSVELPYSSQQFTDEDLVIATKYIDLNKCSYYTNSNDVKKCDCAYGAEGEPEKFCMYQKYGYCPYLFESEKHCRKVRTLKGEKSNRFNLTQELGKVFEVYPVYYIDHEENGKIKKMTDGKPSKRIFYITEKGQENKLGFRYELNLSNISRTIKSDQIVTKLYVEDVDSSISRTGLCSIKTAEDNPSKDSFVIDMSYYIAKGILNEERVKRDLYGVDGADIGYLKILGHYNSNYDKLSDLMINLSSQSFTELQANVETNFEAITTAQQQLQKYKQQIQRYKTTEAVESFNFNFKNGTSAERYWKGMTGEEPITDPHGDLEQKVVEINNYRVEKNIKERNFLALNTSYYYSDNSDNNDDNDKNEGIGCFKFLSGIEDSDKENLRDKLNDLISSFCTKDPTNRHVISSCNYEIIQSQSYQNQEAKINEQQSILNELIWETFGVEVMPTGSIDEFKETDDYKYHTYDKGMVGQFNKEYNQLQTWRKEQSMYLKLTNAINLKFFKKYEPYLKEGTWSDSNYLTDNAYYFGAKEVATQGAIPKVEYNITVVDLYPLEGYEDYKFEIADTTYVEDIGMFGINPKTGLPNRLKVLISEITYDLDQPKNNSIKVQNFTTQFEDLFQQVSASVQSLSFNENIYKRSSNFTSNQSIKQESLQGALDSNDLTLINTQENNVEIDAEGQFGSDLNNHSNQYKLNGQGMFFSNNGGQSWTVGVGPSGINADYIKVGTLDAGKIKIVDNDYLYFLWDKDGILAFREPQDVNSANFNDFAVFNKYGLSLINGNRIRLRAGYAYKMKEGSTKDAGVYSSDDPLGEEIGFYLYDNTGHTIFKTESGEDSARLVLSGEMLATSTAESNEQVNYWKGDSIYTRQQNFEIYYKKTNQDYPDQSATHVDLGNKYVMSINENSFESIPLYKMNDNEDDICYFDGTYKIIEKVIITVNKLDYEQGKFHILESQMPTLYQPAVTYTYYKNTSDSNVYSIDTMGYKDYYTNNQDRFYFNAMKVSEGVGPEEKNSTGVFIGNKILNEDDQTVKRIFSCIKKEEDNSVKNLFTVYDNGVLVMGGTFTHNGTPLDKISSLEDFPDKVYYNDRDRDKTIRIEGGNIYLGETLLTDMISKAAGTLPTHSHYFHLYYDTFDFNDTYCNVDYNTEIHLPIVENPNEKYAKLVVRKYIAHHNERTGNEGWQ